LLESGRIPPLIVLLACSGLACSDDTTEIDSCAVMRTTLITDGPRLCGVTSTGVVLRGGGDEIVLERLNADATLSELVRVPSAESDCGTVSHDVQTDTIWLTVPGFGSLVSTKLYAFDGEGRELSVQSLDVPGEHVEVSASLVHEGALFLAGSIDIGFSSDAERFAWLERRDAQGALTWRKTDLPFTTLDALAGIDGQVSALASSTGPDRSGGESVSLVTLDAASGEISWTKPVTMNDDIWALYPWPTSDYAWLSSDGRAELYVTEAHPGVDETDPARTIVMAYDGDGTTLWRSESEWPFERVRGTEVVVDQDARLSVVSGQGLDDPEVRPVWLARHDQDGVLECTALLNQPGPDEKPTPWMWLGNSLTALDDGRFVLSAAVDEHLDDRLTVHGAAIFVFELRSP
jgi:hypothetical protein